MITELSHPGKGQPSPFDAIRHIGDDGSEYWSARELMPVLGYDKWERFEGGIDRAQASAAAQGQSLTHHFPGAGKMVRLGSGSTRTVIDYRLTRFACYLVAMNSDPRKPEIAMAQAYFVIRTRQAETQQRTCMSSVDQTPEQQLALLRGAADLLGPDETRQLARQILHRALGAVLSPSRHHDPASIEPSITRFWHGVRSHLAWDLLPFTFLYDLYRAIGGDDLVPVSRQCFVSSIAHLVSDDPLWSCDDKSRKFRPRQMMRVHEPLVATYGLDAWAGPRNPHGYRGLLRRVRTAPTDDHPQK